METNSDQGSKAYECLDGGLDVLVMFRMESGVVVQIRGPSELSVDERTQMLIHAAKIVSGYSLDDDPLAAAVEQAEREGVDRLTMNVRSENRQH